MMMVKRMPKHAVGSNKLNVQQWRTQTFFFGGGWEGFNKFS
jgi:hypothetical protein